MKIFLANIAISLVPLCCAGCRAESQTARALNAPHALIQTATPVPVTQHPAVKHQGAVSRVVFGPEDLVATLAPDEIKVWRARSLQAVCTLSLPKGALPFGDLWSKSPFAFSPTGDRFAVIVQSNLIQVHDVQSGQRLLTLGDELREADAKMQARWAKIKGFGSNYYRPMTSVAFSADGKRLLSSGHTDEPPRVWNATTGKMLRSIPNLRFFDETRVVASPDAGTFAIIGSGAIVLADSFTGIIKRRMGGNGGDFSQVAFADAGKKLVSIGYDGIAKTYNCNTGKLLTSFRPLLKDYQGRNWIISTDGKRLSTIYYGEGEIRKFWHMVLDTWDVAKQKKHSRLVFPVNSEKFTDGSHSPNVWDVSQDGSIAVTAGNYSEWQKQSYVWDVGKSELLDSLPPDARVRRFKAFLHTKDGQKFR